MSRAKPGFLLQAHAERARRFAAVRLTFVENRSDWRRVAPQFGIAPLDFVFSGI
jgi:hypothetical protein